MGFTIIELMIVVAIIGILSVIASSSYGDFVVRTQVAEALNLMSQVKTHVGEHYNHLGRYPVDNDEVGLASPSSISGNFVVSVNVQGSPNVAEATFGHRANAVISGQVLQLSVVTDATGILRWQCKSTTILPKYLPSVCR